MPEADFLRHAQALEKSAAVQRVSYYSSWTPDRLTPASLLLDLGCGNGYAVEEWQQKGIKAIGVDYSLYRLSRWVSEKRPGLPLVVADAKDLPFRSGSFATVVSSGMIEHIGVNETTNPYSVEAQPTQSPQRSAAVRELVRVSAPAGRVLIDCPNGGFPVDFWHGDRIGSLEDRMRFRNLSRSSVFETQWILWRRPKPSPIGISL